MPSLANAGTVKLCVEMYTKIANPATHMKVPVMILRYGNADTVFGKL